MLKKKLRVNVGKSKAMRCSRYGNGGRMHVILNGEPLEEVGGFKYLLWGRIFETLYELLSSQLIS